MHRLYTILVIGSWGMLLWPFPVEVFMASCFAILLHPIYNKMLKRWNKKSAVICTSLILCISIILPITIVLLMVVPQGLNGLRILDDLQKSGWINGPEMQAFFDKIDTWIRKVPELEGGITEITSTLTSFLASSIQAIVGKGLGIAGSTMNIMVRICVLISLSIICVLYASHFFNFLKTVSRIPEIVLKRMEETVRQSIRAVLWGVVLVACIQGILCGLAFAVAGLPAPAFWGLVTAFVAPIPFVGTSLVWIPACVYLWFAVSKAASIGLMFWCVIVVVGADNVLRPLFLLDGLRTSFIIVLVSILCGMVAFGAVGIMAGPVLAAFALQAAREAELAAQEMNN